MQHVSATGDTRAGAYRNDLVPPEQTAAGPVTAVVVGALAGLYPALRAARMSPTNALRMS
ncbi:hypothetical protein ACFZB9_19365 [Kitasatospora sp. NPDC008050]|uniref:hypothetical protein n=1 Tax=Kitasatospora sp. NPDC008050 TaxID=3364021 RepID=UPI0036EFEC8B